MRGRHSTIGIALGLAAAVLLTAYLGDSPAAPTPPLPEAGAPLRQIVVHHVAGADVTVGVIVQILRQLPAEVSVLVVCPDEASYRDLRTRADDARCRFQPVVVGHAITPWSRDRWLACAPDARGRITLIRPVREQAGADWPARLGDHAVAADLASALPGRVAVNTSPLLFDAGDFLADEQRVLINRAVLERNVPGIVPTRQALLELLERRFGRPVTILEGSPDHHVGMFLSSAGHGLAVVGDPSLGAAVADRVLQEQFDAVALQMQGLGYRVLRVPVVVHGPKVYQTYTNVLFDRDAGRRIVYLPTYRGAEAMNAAATQVWQDAGYLVRPIDCTDVYPLGGTLHCLINVLSRS